MVFEEILSLIVLLLSIPTGFLIAWLCSDELIQGRVWFKAIILVSIIVFVLSYFYNLFVISFTMLFIIIVSIISLYKSYDKKWTKRIIA